MSILGVLVRTRVEHLPAVAARLGALPGADVALNPGDGRLVVVLEDAVDADGAPVAAAATLGAIATWADVLSTLLVYEYSGADSPGGEVTDYRSWRASLADVAAGPREAPKN